MSQVVIFVANGFTKENVRLQPWRYIYELAKHKSKTCDVYVITEGSTDIAKSKWEETFNVIETRLLSVKRQSALGDLLISLEPNELWWSTTTRTIAFYPVLKRIHSRKVAFITSPIYKWTELLRASYYGIPYEQIKALWSQRFIPRFLFRWFLNSNLFEHIFVQSKNNQNILVNSGVEKDKVCYLPVGIDDEDAQPLDPVALRTIEKSLNKKQGEIAFLYMGAIRPIRGFDSLIKAFPDVIKANSQARLVVLARGSDEQHCEQLQQQLKTKGLQDNVDIIGGWLQREQIWAYIELSDIVVLPFVLVPSDIPIAVLESLARGKPVVVSPVDGLPELAENRGIIVDPLDTPVFSAALQLLSEDKQRLKQYTKNAQEFIKNYPRWSDVGQLMDSRMKADT